MANDAPPSVTDSSHQWHIGLRSLAKKYGNAIGLIIAILGAVTGYFSLRYDISIEPIEGSDVTKSIAADFKVTNLSPFDAIDIIYDCEFYRPHPKPYEQFTLWGPIQRPMKRIEHNSRVDIRCPIPSYQSIKDAPGLILKVYVHYSAFPYLTRHLGASEFEYFKGDVDSFPMWHAVGNHGAYNDSPPRFREVPYDPR